MVAIGGLVVPIPLTVGAAFGFLINALITFAIIMVLDAIIAHQIQGKKIFVLSILSYFMVPVIVSALDIFISLPGVILGYLIPLIVWIILSEIMLEATKKKKLLIAILAYVLNIIFGMFLVPAILGLI